jgi:four helix bundle protein
MQRFTDLTVWKRGHALTLEIYESTRSFPREEQFGLRSQLRRASVSIPCNIAEGSKRRHRPDYARFLNHAEASSAEIQALLLLSKDLGYLSSDKTLALLEKTKEVSRMLDALRSKVELIERRESGGRRALNS